MRGKRKQFWECPICHIKIPRWAWALIEIHKREHPNNQRAFNYTNAIRKDS